MKKIIIVIIMISAVGGGIFFYLKYRKSKDFEALIKTKLQELVKDGSNGLYNLKMDKIEIDILNSKLILDNAQLLIDSIRLNELNGADIAPIDIFRITLKTLNVDGLSIRELLDTKNINLEKLNIKEPLVEVFHRIGTTTPFLNDTSTLYQRIAKSLGHFELKNLTISSMDLIYHNLSKKG